MNLTWYERNKHGALCLNATDKLMPEAKEDLREPYKHMITSRKGYLLGGLNIPIRIKVEDRIKKDFNQYSQISCFIEIL